jgi:hypothetical protein
MFFFFQSGAMIISDNGLQNGEFSFQYLDRYYSPFSEAYGKEGKGGKGRSEIHSREECQANLLLVYGQL